MPEARYIIREGRSILLMDFARVEDWSALPKLVDEAIRLAQSSNNHYSVLAMIDLSGTRITKPLAISLKRLSKNNGPYIKAVAFVGLRFPASLLFSVFLRISGRRNHTVAQTREQAIRWLVVQ